jgi:hypothetical protein
MAITIVDFLIWLQVIGVWVRGERRRLILRLDGGKIHGRIVVLIGFKIFMEVLEHSELGVLV